MSKAVLAVLVAMAGPAKCDSYEVWATWLTSQFNQYNAFQYIIQDGTIGEVWIDPIEGDWTVLTVPEMNYRCQYDYGSQWPEGRR